MIQREAGYSGCTVGLELVYTAGMVATKARGYFGIGAEGVSKSANVGALLRTGHAFGASFCFTIGSGWDSRAGRTADTSDTPLHVPMWRYPTSAEVSLPHGCALVGIELLEDAVDLPSFRHPLNAAYVLGPERSGLSVGVLERCDHVVSIPTCFALNLAVAGALVLYDRLLQHGRFAERPVGSRGPVEALAKSGHGPPRFRKTIPDWLRPDKNGPDKHGPDKHGPDRHGPDGPGSDGPGSDGPGSDGPGSDGRGPDGLGPDAPHPLHTDAKKP